jgi:hypothetical protein
MEDRAYIDGKGVSAAQAIMMAAKAQKKMIDAGVLPKPQAEIVEEAKDNQLKEIGTAADLPIELKRKITIEYMRLRQIHPGWKPKKLARKAGEKYNVKFEFQ